MTAAIVIAVVLGLAGTAAMWALAAYTRRLDGKVDASETPTSSGSGTQTMATQMASGYEPPSMSLSPAPEAERCGAQGPIGMRCDWPPHDGMRHAEDGLTWISNGGPAARPTHLGNAPARGEATP